MIMIRFGRLVLLCAFVLAFASVSVWAQGGAGELTGIVYDPTGAVVPGATVRVTNPATGVSRETTTSAAGVYRFPSLPVGSYDLTIEASGFRRSVIQGITISVGLTVTEDVTLEVGAIAETVTVEAGAVELVQTTESQVSAAVDEVVWKEFPLEFRNQNEFINLLAGVVPDAFAGSTRGAAVAGARGGTGNFLVEGYDNNDQGQGGRGAIVAGAITSISPEAIQEYRVISQNYSAQYGKGGGFVTDTVLKSGTNEIHGSAFLYNRVQKLAANSFFSNAGGVEDARIRNQFGGSLGGPIIKDKTFAFGALELHRFRESTPDSAIVTGQAFLNFVNSGAFAAFMESDPNGACFVFNGAACPGAFANSSSLGPIFQSILSIPGQLWPEIQRNPRFESENLLTGGIVYPVPIFGEATLINKSVFNENRFSLKVDHQASDKDSFSGTFLFEDSDASDSIEGSGSDVGVPIASIGRSLLVGVTYNRVFTPTVINQFRVSYLRHTRDFPTLPGFDGIPDIATGIDSLGVGLGQTGNLPQFFTDNQFQYQNHLSWIVGKHSFKAGAEYRRTRNGSAFEALKFGVFVPYGVEDMVTDLFFGDELDLAVFGAPVFGSAFFAQAAIDPTANGGLGGPPQQYRGFRANEFAGYIQDDIRVTSRLTLNVGLRWEYFGIPHNFRDGVDSNFFFGNALLPVPTASTNPFFPFSSPTAARVATGGFRQVDENVWGKDTNNFAPRFGFAYDVTGEKKIVIRGGGGIFYDRIWNNLFENIRFNPPFHCFCFFGALINGIPMGALSSPGVYQVPFSNYPAFNVPGVVPSARHMDENLVTAYWEQFYLGTQWRFRPDFVLEVNYVSTLGRKLHGLIDINTFNGRNSGGDTTRPLPTLGGDNFRTNAFKSSYHGLQVTVRKRFSHGLQFQSNYTWGHAIDEVSDAFNNRQGLRPTNGFNIALDRSNADFDIRHRTVTSFYYELPLWKNNALAGGWAISGIVTAQTGVPIPIGDSGRDPNGDGYRTERPIFIGAGDPNDAVLDGQSPADGYLDTNQFARMATDGSSCVNGVVLSSTQWWCDGIMGRNVITGPGYANVDFSIQKKFRIGERFGLEFQANFFNLFNRSNFTLPVSNINSGSFGRSLGTFDPRITQLALRIDF